MGFLCGCGMQLSLFASFEGSGGWLAREQSSGFNLSDFAEFMNTSSQQEHSRKTNVYLHLPLSSWPAAPASFLSSVCILELKVF